MKKFSVHWEELVLEAHWGIVEAETLEEAKKLVKQEGLYATVDCEGHEFIETEDVKNIEVVDLKDLI